MGNLYIVATPIGNLGDMTIRGLETLKSVDAIACEDTRHTVKLLNHFGIHKKLLSVRAQNEAYGAEKVLEFLAEGQSVAYVSDAGTPGVSDPGAVLVHIVREAGYTVIPIPGVSALSCLLSIGGLSYRTVSFEGFLSPKPGRRRSRLRELMERDEPFVIYESPYRAVKLMEDIAEIDPERWIVIGREMTKVHEEYRSGTAVDVRDAFRERKDVLGEFAVLVSHGKKT